MSGSNQVLRRGLSIFGWIVTAVSVAILLGLIALMIHTQIEMNHYCGMNDGYYHSGECKDLGSVGRFIVLASGFFLILAAIRPVIYFVSKSRSVS